MIPVHATVGGTRATTTWQDHAHVRTVILILRLSAMFGGSKALLYSLLGLLGGQIIAEIAIVQSTVVHQNGELAHTIIRSLIQRFFSLAAFRLPLGWNSRPESEPATRA